MKNRLEGFLSNKNIPHDSEIFDYIGELHTYLWRFVRCVFPFAQGNLSDYLDIAIEQEEWKQKTADRKSVV